MKTQSNSTPQAHLLQGVFYLLLLLAACEIPFALAQSGSIGPTTAAGLTFADRVAHQWAIEDVYWRHRIWPTTNAAPKPPLGAVMSQAQLENKVEDYLRNSQALADYWQRPITADQLQAEMKRMASDTRQPEVLRELFEALGNDPFVIAECLARPVLTERLIADLSGQDKNGRFESLRTAETQMPKKVAAIDSIAEAVQVNRPYQLPVIASPSGGCIDDTWSPTNTTNAPDGQVYPTAVWTGSEMIVWGGYDASGFLVNTGGRYNPSTDSWTATSTTNAPTARYKHTAVWTGSEMIVWGGFDNSNVFNTGGRYNPITDTWTATSPTNAPSARVVHTAVWAGSEMIVWGGCTFDGCPTRLNTGGRYDPGTDSWTATSTTGAPSTRGIHTAVWTDSEMIVWGGWVGNFSNTGGRYHPSTDSWTATSTINAPTARDDHTAVWTGSEMIVWGGYNGVRLNTGGRYNPGANTWIATSLTNAPEGRIDHTAVWTGSEMIVWGGRDPNNPIWFNTGGRYNRSTNTWATTTTTGAPSARGSHTAVWTDSEMIVWGGTTDATGGRYCAVTAVPFTLSALGRKVGGVNTVRLTWSGANSTNIDVYRNSAVVVTVPNNGRYTDSTGDTGRARYTYKVCEAGTMTCSNQVTVRFRQ